MKLERKKNTIKSAIWGVINRLITILGPFVIRTIIIYTLGKEYLGLSSLFTSILQILSLAELGFSSAIAYSLYKPISENNDELICQILGYFKKVYRVVGIVVLTTGLILMPFLRVFIHGDIPNDINIYALYTLYLINSSVSYFLFAYKSIIFSSYQREDIKNATLSVLMIFQYVFQIVVLLIFSDYYIYYAIVPLISIINNLFINYLTNKYYPNLKPKKGLTKEVKADVRQKVYGVMISKLCGVSRTTFSNIIISTYLGLTTVAIYNNYYYISSNIASILVIIVTAMRAGIGNSVVTETKEKNYNDFNKFTFLYNWMSSVCVIGLVCVFQPFMQLWMGEKNMFSFDIVLLVCVYFYWQTMADITNAYSGAVGLWWENKYRTILEAISNLILTFILGKFYGIRGILIATIITILLFNFIGQVYILYKYYFKEFSVSRYYLTNAFYNIATFFVCAITLFLCRIVDSSPFIEVVYRGIVCLIIPNILFGIIYLKSKYMKESYLYVKDILIKRR